MASTPAPFAESPSSDDPAALDSKPGAPPLGTLAVTHLKLVNYALALIPLAYSSFFFAYKRHENLVDIKPVLEEAALYVLGFLILTALGRFAASRHAFFLWYAGLGASFFIRELHFPHATAIMFGCVAMLGLIAWRKYHTLLPYLRTRLLNNFIYLTLLAYAGSQAMDKYKPPDRHDRYLLNPVEETLELFGHVCLLLAVVFIRKPADPAAPPDAPRDLSA
ncbi:MAG: hypothetical protein AMXMBFR7_36440 [Planctomycetota bacterium]